MEFFVKLSLILFQLELLREEFTKLTISILMGSFDLAICPGLSVLFLYVTAYKACLFEKFIFELESSSYSFKITCILLKQVISPKNIVMSSAKFTNLISWSPVCNPFILLSASMKLASTSAVTIYNTNESGNPW